MSILTTQQRVYLFYSGKSYLEQNSIVSNIFWYYRVPPLLPTITLLLRDQLATRDRSFKSL